MKKALLQLIPVKRDGRREKITKLQAFATQLVNKATQGDYQSIRILLSYCSWIHSELTEPIRQHGGLPPEVGRAIRRALLGLPEEDDSFSSAMLQSIEHAPTTLKPELEPLKAEKRTESSEVGFGRPPAQYRFRKGRSSVDSALDHDRRQPKNLNKIVRRRLLKSMDSDDG